LTSAALGGAALLLLLPIINKLPIIKEKNKILIIDNK
jgi:hypothetical protein